MTGALGTYCWSSNSGSICADAVGVPVNKEKLTVLAGSTLTFAYGGKKLDSLSISADRIGKGNHLERMGDVSVLVPDEGSKEYRTTKLQIHRFGNRAHVAAESCQWGSTSLQSSSGFPRAMPCTVSAWSWSNRTVS